MEKEKLVRVLHYGLSENPGGIETYLLKIASGICKKKFEFSFIEPLGSKVAFHDELENLGSGFYQITPRKVNYKKNKRDVAKLFDEGGFDILHYHVNTLSYIEPVLAALKKDVRVVVHSRNAGAGGSRFTQVMHAVNKFRVNRLSSNVKKIAVSSLAGEWLFGKGSSFDIYNNGVDLARFKFCSSAREGIRSELEVGEETHLLGCVAAFSPAKNQQFLVDILRVLRDSKYFSNVKLLLVGDGALKPKVQDLVESYHLDGHVKFLGKRSDIPELMSAMDTLLLPSFFEGFPNVVLEAQACGLQCLISDRITDEVVLDNGLVRQLPIDELSIPIWVEELKRCMQLPIALERRLTAWQGVEAAGFSTECEIKKIEELYEQLMSS